MIVPGRFIFDQVCKIVCVVACITEADAKVLLILPCRDSLIRAEGLAADVLFLGMGNVASRPTNMLL